MSGASICPFGALDLARYAVTKCSVDGKPVSNLHLQKMMFFLQVGYCARTGGLLLFGDEFEAWQYGPVLREVYAEFRPWHGYMIEDRFDVDPDHPSGALKAFVDDGIESLREFAPGDLVSISHAPGTPWREVYREGEKRRIPNRLIVDFCSRNGVSLAK